MYHIRANAEMSVRNLLRDVVKRAGSNVLTSVDYLDDGSPVINFPSRLPMITLTMYLSHADKSKS
jgi:hypothetical protein